MATQTNMDGLHEKIDWDKKNIRRTKKIETWKRLPVFIDSLNMKVQEEEDDMLFVMIYF